MTRDPFFVKLNIIAAAWVDQDSVSVCTVEGVTSYGDAPVSPAWRELAFLWKASGLPRNFGRFPSLVRGACTVAAMLLRHSRLIPDIAAVEEDERGKVNMDVGILSAGFSPTHQINHDYFSDYIEGGRILGRGNLFIYTLPTAALAEVSICFGLTGPILFLETECQPFMEVLTTAAAWLHRQQTGSVICLWFDQRQVAGLYLSRAAVSGRPVFSPETVFEQAGAWRQPGQLIDFFRQCKGMK